MDLNENIKDIVIDYIAKGRIQRLEKAFQNQPKLVTHIRSYWAAHEKFMKTMDDWCKKHPEACKERNLKK